MSQSYAKFTIGILVVIVICLTVVWFGQRATLASADMTDDLAGLSSISGSFVELSDYFASIAREKGAVYAYDLLQVADLGANIDVHLLGHLIGDELYKQEGIEGMRFCTNDFRNACSHSVVIGALLAEGSSVFDVVNDVCQMAPGGKGAYTMCFHGFGHGVLAYNEYEMEDAVQMCERVGTEPYHSREYAECVGGAVMEMTGGVHDVALRTKKSEKYLSDTNPLALCQASYMDPLVQPVCYSYITPVMFTQSGVGIAFTDPAELPNAFSYCDTLPQDDLTNRDACYGGFGKEFVVLVRDRDVRDFTKMTDEQLATIDTWCRMAGNDFGTEACIASALSSLYWGGENDVSVPLRFCEVLDGEERQGECIHRLTAHVKNYIDDYEYRESFCDSLGEAYIQTCREAIL